MQSQTRIEDAQSSWHRKSSRTRRDKKPGKILLTHTSSSRRRFRPAGLDSVNLNSRPGTAPATKGWGSNRVDRKTPPGPPGAARARQPAEMKLRPGDGLVPIVACTQRQGELSRFGIFSSRPGSAPATKGRGGGTYGRRGARSSRRGEFLVPCRGQKIRTRRRQAGLACSVPGSSTCIAPLRRPSERASSGVLEHLTQIQAQAKRETRVKGRDRDGRSAWGDHPPASVSVSTSNGRRERMPG
jgi:hypothetical protein